MPRRLLRGASGWLLPLAALAAVAALVAASDALARRSDLLLAALVLFTALGIGPAQLTALRRHPAEVAALILAPFAVLAPVAWLIGRLFSGAVRDGVVALGVSSTEIAAVGLVALGGGSAGLALGALAGSPSSRLWPARSCWARSVGRRRTSRWPGSWPGSRSS